MTFDKAPDLLVFCASSFGGIADYAHSQAEALGKRGWTVLMLCPPEFHHESGLYSKDACLQLASRRSSCRFVRIAKLVVNLLVDYSILENRIRTLGVKRVLMATYIEYLAPFWAWRLRRLRRRGVAFAAVVHDPVRDFVVGPLWWHRYSISEGYSYLDYAFVHEKIDLDTGNCPQRIQTQVIPHGPFPFPDALRSRNAIRMDLKIPEDAALFLSFGHIRDGKNLKLILAAIAEIPEVWLLVAGTEAGSGHATSQDYREMAVLLGVADRCIWEIGFARADLVAEYFTAADFILLTYSASFRSASGVLNVAACYRKPVLASCGESNLASCVERYQLGVRVRPDDVNEIRCGMQQLLEVPSQPLWSDYDLENSWLKNADIVKKIFDIDTLDDKHQ